MTLQIYPIPAFRDNYIWIIHNTAHAVVVDPGDAIPVLDFLQFKKLQLNAILITHHHSDHTGGNQTLLDQFDVPVYGPKHEMIPTVTHPIDDGDIVDLIQLPLALQAINVPGHTRGHIAYHGLLPGTQEQNILFCGDTLFVCGCGRIFEGTPQQMYQSLQKLAHLPDNTKVYCTHEYTLSNIRFARTVEPNNTDLQKLEKHAELMRSQNTPTVPSSIAAEKNCNPFLRCTQPEIIKTTSQYTNKKLTNALEVFTALREWKNDF